MLNVTDKNQTLMYTQNATEAASATVQKDINSANLSI